MADITRVDFNLLVVFDAVFRERNVSRAAKQLHLSQPAVSGALSRLRHLTRDQLFMRTRGGMIPTKRAVELSEPVQQALSSLRHALLATERFNPETSNRTFTLLLSEIGQILFLPAISEAIRQSAPAIRLVMAKTDPSEHLAEFEKGDIDLAVGVWPHLRKDIVRQDLMQDDWLCVARKNHPAIGRRLSLNTYLKLEHITISSVSGGDEVITRTLARHNVERRIALEVTDFLAPLLISARTDLIATVPSALARFFAGASPIRLIGPPIDFPHIPLRLYWHKRLDADGGRQWLTQIITEVFETGEYLADVFSASRARE